MASLPITLQSGFQSVSLTFRTEISTRRLRVAIAPLADEVTDRNNQLDISLTRDFRVGRVALKPQLDLFNVFNVSPVTNEVATFGSQLGQPLTILPGRLLRFGFRMNY